MPARGWAGSRESGPAFKCAVCLRHFHAFRDAVTQIGGTLVCMEHVAWMPVPVTPPADE